jgi:predicted transcriptional regulator
MKKKAKPEKVIQSTLRLPESIWKRIHAIAAGKRLSMAQAAVTAIEEYCEREEKGKQS